ncbi:MAG: hypothetical protein KC766_27625 [Myxococcales bacterium]|nr:hypothetical protein [Myxococcales bacterium]
MTREELENELVAHLTKHRRTVRRTRATMRVLDKLEAEGLTYGASYRGALLELNSCYRELDRSGDKLKELWVAEESISAVEFDAEVLGL